MKTVLLVEDETIIQMNNIRIFEMLSYKVISASNGKEAIMKFEENKVDLIVMDVNMPHMCGIESAKEIRKLHSSKNIPIIFFTGHNVKKETLKVPGKNLFLSKPMSLEKLKTIIEEL